MQRPGIALVVVVLLGGTAAAQAPEPAGPPAPAAEASLEQQVTEQATAQGVALARRNLAVRIEQSGAQSTVSLVESAGGRVVATIKLDALPEDRDAAVAALAQAVAGLAAQVDHRVNELKFRLLALRLDPTYDTEAAPAPRADRRWLVFRGAANQRIDAPAFYKALGRDDLVDEYDHRRTLMYAGYVVGMAGFVAAAALNFGVVDLTSCDGLTGPQSEMCTNGKDRSLAPTLAALGIGVVGALFGTWYYRHPQPIDESDARAMADAYNQRLRRTLGIDAVASSPRVSEVRLVPYVDGHDARLVLGARF